MSSSRNKYLIKTAQPNFDFEKQERALSEFLEENGINYLQLFPGLHKDISDRGNRLYFGDHDLHWNTTGHVLVAGLIHNKLKENKLVPIEAKKLSVKRN